MSIECAICKKPIESKSDLIVENKWWIFPKPLHKACWGDTSMTHGGAGSLSYQTGVFQGRKNRHIPINSIFFTIIAVAALVFGIIVLFMDFSGATATVNGVATHATWQQQLALKLMVFTVLMIPVVQRIWSYSKIESNIPS